MKKTLAAFVAAATIAGAFVTAMPAAQAQHYHHHHGGGGAGLAAGLIGGAIIGGAIASSRPAYGYGERVYVEEAPPVCRLVRERYWDGYDWRFRRVEVCR